MANTPFAVRLPLGLWLRLVPQGNVGWLVTVKPSDAEVDYLWPVSPPFRTSPHLFIGPTHGLSAAESVRICRDLRFVLSEEGYRIAAEAAQSADVEAVNVAIARYGKGRLRLTITGFKAAEAEGQSQRGASLKWVTFKGEACVPRSE
jgi:hypothetical protein